MIAGLFGSSPLRIRNGRPALCQQRIALQVDETRPAEKCLSPDFVHDSTYPVLNQKGTSCWHTYRLW
jgi:hypothetical protein